MRRLGGGWVCLGEKTWWGNALKQRDGGLGVCWGFREEERERGVAGAVGKGERRSAVVSASVAGRDVSLRSETCFSSLSQGVLLICYVPAEVEGDGCGNYDLTGDAGSAVLTMRCLTAALSLTPGSAWHAELRSGGSARKSVSRDEGIQCLVRRGACDFFSLLVLCCCKSACVFGEKGRFVC